MSAPIKKIWHVDETGERQLTLAEISEVTGLSRDTISQHVRNGVYFPAKGVPRPVAKLSEKLRLSRSAVQHRIKKGLPLMSGPLKKGMKPGNGWWCWLVSDGERHGTLEAWALELGVSPETVRCLVVEGKLEKVGQMRLPRELEKRFMLS